MLDKLRLKASNRASVVLCSLQTLETTQSAGDVCNGSCCNENLSVLFIVQVHSKVDHLPRYA